MYLSGVSVEASTPIDAVSIVAILNVWAFQRMLRRRRT